MTLRALAGRLGATGMGLVPDALMLAGAGGVSYGAWLVYAPAGFIVGGVFLLVSGVRGARGGA